MLPKIRNYVQRGYQKNFVSSQLKFTCSKPTIETLKKGVKYVNNKSVNNNNNRTKSVTSLWCFYC